MTVVFSVNIQTQSYKGGCSLYAGYLMSENRTETLYQEYQSLKIALQAKNIHKYMRDINSAEKLRTLLLY